MNVWNSREWFFSGNNVCGNIVTLFQERLEGDHNWASEIYEVRVVFHLFCENIAQIDDSSNVINVDIFRLMELTNHIFLEV